MATTLGPAYPGPAWTLAHSSDLSIHAGAFDDAALDYLWRLPVGPLDDFRRANFTPRAGGPLSPAPAPFATTAPWACASVASSVEMTPAEVVALFATTDQAIFLSEDTFPYVVMTALAWKINAAAADGLALLLPSP
jgi:hypothetical protein